MRTNLIPLLCLVLTSSFAFMQNAHNSSDYPTTIEIFKEIDFTEPSGLYTEERWAKDWDDPRWEVGLTKRQVEIIKEDELRMQINLLQGYPKDNEQREADYNNGVKWIYTFSSREQATLEYLVKFQADFDFVRGGKLPGLCGGECNSGGQKPTGNDGWSARVMWREEGRAVSYVYRANRGGWPWSNFGEDFQWIWPDSATNVAFKPNEVYKITQRITMNSPDQANGQLEVWLNELKVLNKTDILWRKNDEFAIDSLMMNVFYGGNDSTWAVKKDEFLWLDKFILSE